MTKRAILIVLIALTAITCSSADATLAQRLCSQYKSLKTITCEIRKTTKTEAGTFKILSRIFYQNSNRIHIENISPSKRTIIADGEKLYYYQDGFKRGFSRPIKDLDASWKKSLENVPGTAMEHLLRLKDTPEIKLIQSPEHPVRKGYQTEKHFVVLSCNDKSQLVLIEFFQTPEMKDKKGSYKYSEFQKITEDISIPCLHKGILFLPNGEKVEETRRITNMEANKPITENMFNADFFLKDLEFTSNFMEMNK